MLEFAKLLIGSESTHKDLKSRYEEQKRALIERRLTPLQKVLGWVAVLINSALALGFSYRHISGTGLPGREWQVLEGVSALGLLLLGLWIFRVLLRGGRVTQRDDHLMQWIGGIGIAALTFGLFELARSLSDPEFAMRLYSFGTILLVGGAFSVLVEQLRRAKLEIRVQLLELELRVNELAQAISAHNESGR